MKSQGTLIQVGGAGKSCGKTTFICSLLPFFSKSAAVKCGFHHQLPLEASCDSNLFRSAGALETLYLATEEESEITHHVKSLLLRFPTVFLERNRRLSDCQPDCYIFIDKPVQRIRDDAFELRAKADIILNDFSNIKEIWLKIINTLQSDFQ